MKIDDVRALTHDQLADELLKLKKEQFNLRFQAATGQIEKTHRVNEVRKDIARIKTVLYNIWNSLRVAAMLLYPFMPTKSNEIRRALGLGTPMESVLFDDEKAFYCPDGIGTIDKIAPIFPRIEV